MNRKITDGSYFLPLNCLQVGLDERPFKCTVYKEARVAAIKLGLKSSRLSDQPDTSPQWPPTRRVKPRMTHGRNPPNPAKRLPRSPPPVVDFPVTQRPRVTHGQKSEWPITSATPPQQAERQPTPQRSLQAVLAEIATQLTALIGLFQEAVALRGTPTSC
ncbi:hypothetical protein J6590_034307 [Homalodisca vitripennis]|nr:hypothetical protein J6590_034307 [Homalodisca vitripennis]